MEKGRRPVVAMLILNNSGMGGAERRFLQVYEGLRGRNLSIALAINESLLASLRGAGLIEGTHPPDLIVRERVGALSIWLKGIERGGARSLAFWLGKLDYLLGSFTVCRWLMQQRPQVMHLVLGGVYVVLPLQLIGWAPPAVVSVVGPKLREMVGAMLGLKLYRLSLRKACVVDALTDTIRDAVREQGITEERIKVSVGSCINTNRFRPLPVKHPWVVFTGRLILEKNPLLFVEACSIIYKRIHPIVPDVRFFVLGDGPLRNDIERSIHQCGLTACTTIGWCEHTESVLGAAQIFVSLQQTDNYPSQALLEAMACGAAVVATDVGLTWKLVDESVGIRVPSHAASVAHAVVHLLKNPETAAHMGLRGRMRVACEHSMDQYMDYLEELYKIGSRDQVMSA